MTALFTEIQESLLELLGQTITAIPGLGIALAVLFSTRVVAKLVKRGTDQLTQSAIKSPSLRMLTIQTAYVATLSAGTLAACVIAFPDLRLGDIIGFLGLGSVAIGFAFQDIFKNFLAGILLLLQEPFQIGDQILVGKFEGTVEEISIRSTQIRTYKGERVVVPNAIVFTSPVEVRTAFAQRRTDLEIGLDYNTPLAAAREVLLEATQAVEGVLSQPPVEVDLVGFGSSSINFVVRYWTFPEIAQVRRTKSLVIIALKAACDRANYHIPYPIRTVYHFEPEKYHDPYSMTTNANPTTNGDRHIY